jgi:sugar lactone lactonase YvrE
MTSTSVGSTARRAALRICALVIATAVVALRSAAADAYYFSTFAGKVGRTGTADGAREHARLGQAAGVCVDDEGNVYIAEYYNNVVRKVSPAGIVETIAGLAGVDNTGANDGYGDLARFYYPAAVACDHDGNVYVADSRNHTIRRIDRNRIVTTVAGRAGQFGRVDGTGENARFFSPSGIAVGPQNELYVSDTESHTIRKISPGGVVTTLAGSGTNGGADGIGRAAEFSFPAGVVVDGRGFLYVADRESSTIREISPEGVVTTVAGKAWETDRAGFSIDGVGSVARFSHPTGLAIDRHGVLYVADTVHNTIRKIQNGVVSTIGGPAATEGLGRTVDGLGENAHFSYPVGVAVDRNGTLYIVQSEGAVLRKGWPAAPAAPTWLDQPVGETLVEGSEATFRAVVSGYPMTFAYEWQCLPPGESTWRSLSESSRSVGTTSATLRVREVSTAMNGTRYRCVATNGVGAGIVSTAATLWVLEAPTGYTISTVNSPFDLRWADGRGTDARLERPFGVAVDREGNIYVADDGNCAIRKIDVGANVSTAAGALGQSGPSDGPAASARFGSGTSVYDFGPRGMAIDAQGNIYIADAGNNSIRKIGPGNQVSTMAGSSQTDGTSDGTGAAARFYHPAGLTIDAAGDLYIADTDNQLIRRMTPAGVVTTVAGTGRASGAVDGDGRAARFSEPHGIVADGKGNLFVADTGNHTIRKITREGRVSTFAGAPGQAGHVDGMTADARFNRPMSLAIDSAGILYVTDSENRAVRAVEPTGRVWTLAGDETRWGGMDGSANGARFRKPRGITLDGRGRLIVTDHNAVRMIDRVTGRTTVIAGCPAEFIDPFGGTLSVAADPQDNVYTVTNGWWYERRTVIRLAQDGQVAVAADGSSEFAYVAAAADGWVYVSRSGSGFAKIAPDGVVREARTSVYSLSGAIVVGDNHDLYGADVQKVFSTGDGLPDEVIAGQGYGSTDGPGKSAQFRNLTGLALLPSRTLYVADTGNHTIRRISADSVVSTIGGTAGAAGATDGPANSSRFNAPEGVAVDRAGNVYVGDTGNHTIRRIGADGRVTTIAGAAGVIGREDGPGATARFKQPGTIAVLRDGTLYIADRGNGFLRKATPIRSGASLPPRFAREPATQGVVAGSNVSFTVGLSGSDRALLEWQVSVDQGATWSAPEEGGAYAGVNAGTLSVSRVTTAMNGLRLRCVATNAFGRVVSREAVLLVRSGQAPASRLTNISARAYCSTGNSVTIGGFVVGGTLPKRVLIRAVGPSLTTQGIGQNEVLLDPTVEVHHAGAIVARNDDWGSNENASEIPVVAATIGATALAAGDTRSSALLTTLDPGVYTFLVKGKNDTSGIVLLEVYDADGVVTDSKFVNIAARGFATTGNGVAIGGFVISGNTSKRVLMRAVGPTLTTQGIAQNEVLLDPTIELHHGSDPAIENDNWGSNPNQAEIVATGARVGATPIAATDTTSSALLLTLNPGVYTFIAKGRNDTSGIVLVEVYDAD